MIEPSLWDSLPEYVKEEINKVIAFEPKEMKEVVHGKWISPKENMVFQCTNCGKEMLFWTQNKIEHPLEKGYNFCPNCGADMRGEEHGIN